MIEIEFTLDVFFFVILLQDGLVFEHFKREKIEPFVELGQLTEIIFFYKVFCL